MRYSLVFGFSSLVGGNGFVARVEINGRALAEEDENETWLYGVNPGGFAADAPTRGEAFGTFKQAYLSVLYDLAEENGSFEEFKSAVEKFFHSTNAPAEAEWKQAVEEAREGRLTVEGMEKRVGSADQKPSIKVVLVATAANCGNNTKSLMI